MSKTMAFFTSSVLLLHAAVSAQQISPYLTGTNVWYNPSDAVWAVHATAGHKMIRIGGAAPDQNMPSLAQLTTWVNKIKAMGAEPLIQVSQYQSAAAAAAIVKYFNVDTKNPVKFWNIGNEPWLQAGKPAMNTMPGKIAGYVKPAASAMKAIDPTIKIFVADECYYDAGLYTELFNSGSANDIGGKDAAGHYYVDGASWHRYNSGNAITGADDIIGSMKASQDNIAAANIRHGRTGSDKLSWGIGEFNSDAGAGLPCSFPTGQMVGAVYGAAMRYEATYAVMWSMLEGGGTCGGTDFSIIGNDLKPRPTFNHMQLVAKNMSGTYANGTSNMGANIYAYGSKSSKDMAAMIINRGAQAYTFKLRMDKVAIVGNGVNIDAGVAAQQDVTIAASTTMLLVFGLDGTLVKRYTYNASMAAPKLENLNVPPVIDTPVVVVSQPIPGKIEAESYSDMQGIQTETTGDAQGGALNVGWFDAGDWMDYTVDVSSAGKYQVSFRLASPNNAGSFALKDGKQVTLGQILVPKTTGFQDYVNVLDTVELAAGKQTLRIEAATGGWNFNWMTFEKIVPSSGILDSRRGSEGFNSIRTLAQTGKVGLSFTVDDPTGASLEIIDVASRILERVGITNSGAQAHVFGGSRYSRGAYFAILKTRNGVYKQLVLVGR